MLRCLGVLRSPQNRTGRRRQRGSLFLPPSSPSLHSQPFARGASQRQQHTNAARSREGREASQRLVRNIGVIAHIDAGKTTTTERMLYLVGQTRHQGSVDTGDTVTDFMPEERERGITIQSAAVSLSWRGCDIHLIDTPGHVDFSIEVERCVRVLDGAVLVLDAVAGVQAQTETVWRTADRFQVPAVAFVNKMDRDGADFPRAAASLSRRLGVAPLPIQTPIGSGDGFRGFVDLLTMQAAVYSGSGGSGGSGSSGGGGGGGGAAVAPRAAARDSVVLEHVPLAAAEALDPGVSARAAAARAALLEALAEVDEEFLEIFVDGGEAEGDYALPELLSALRRACLSRAAVPVLCGASLRGVGVEPLLDSVAALLPSPLDRPRPRGVLAAGVGVAGRGPAAAAAAAARTAAAAAARPAAAAAEAVAEAAGGAGKGRRQQQQQQQPRAGSRAAAAAAATSSGDAAADGAEVDPLGEDLVALAFKVTHDKQRGNLVFFRVYSGTMTARSAVFNSTRGVKERVQQLLQIHAGEARLIDSAPAGHVAAAVGLSATRTGDTLLSATAAGAGNTGKNTGNTGASGHSAARRLTLEGVHVPDPVFALAVEPFSAAEQQRLDAALAAVALEDPSLRVDTDPDSGQTLLRGAGELHLEVVRDRLAREFNVPVRAGRARVAYREGVSGDGSGSREVERIVGGRRMFAGVDVQVRARPLPPLGVGPAAAGGLAPAEVSVDLRGGGAEPQQPAAVLSPEAAEALLSGLQEACGRGPLGGYPLVGASAAVVAVRSDADTTPGALRLAVAMALREAVEAAGAVLLEPVMQVEVSAPAAYVGTVLNDLTGARRAHVAGVDAPGGGGGGGGGAGAGGGEQRLALARHTVTAMVPLRELLGYATALRSITGGEGSFSMELAGYGPMDAATAKAALAESW